MVSGIVRGAMSAVIADEKLVKSARSEEMRKAGEKILEKIVEGDHEIQLLDDFSTSLTSNINLIFSNLPKNIKTLSSKMSRCWSTFHALHQEILPKLWQDLWDKLNLEVNSLFTESVNQELFQQLLITLFAEQCKPATPKDHATNDTSAPSAPCATDDTSNH